MSGAKRPVYWHLAWARLRASRRQSLLQAGAVLLSMLALSFFAFLLLDLSALSTAGGALPYARFFRELIDLLRAVAGVLIALSLLTLLVYCRTGQERDARFLAALTSLGATAGGRCRVLLYELAVLYTLPMLGGCLLGLLPAAWFGSALAASTGLQAPPHSARLALLPALVLLGSLLVLLLRYTPVPGRRTAVIDTLRRRNAEEEREGHAYRRSRTFRGMPITQRIAKKSVDFYKRPYRRIAWMLAAAMLYPLLGLIVLGSMAGGSIVADTNPFDGVDTEAMTITAVSNLAGLIALAFLLLSLLAVCQVAYLFRLQNEQRGPTLAVYRAVGMAEADIRRLTRYEYRTVALHALVYVVFAMAVLLSLLAV